MNYRRSAFIIAALCLAALPLPSHGKGSTHSPKSHYSLGSPSKRHTYSAPSYARTHKSSSPTPRSLSRTRHSPSSATFSQPRRRITSKPYRVTTPRRTSAPSAYYQSGLAKHRSEEAKQKFLRQHHLKRVPPGYEIDHTVPLSEGGSDTPANMELLTKSAHHAKTAAEAKRYGWHRTR